MLKIIFSKQAERMINKLFKKEPKLIPLILKKIDGLSVNSTPPDSKKLVNRSDYRIRVRNYRVIYEFDDISLYITLIDKRDKIYK